jgi:hypothetical protein
LILTTRCFLYAQLYIEYVSWFPKFYTNRNCTFIWDYIAFNDSSSFFEGISKKSFNLYCVTFLNCWANIGEQKYHNKPQIIADIPDIPYIIQRWPQIKFVSFLSYFKPRFHIISGNNTYRDPHRLQPVLISSIPLTHWL